MQDEEPAREELKRIDHLIFVTLKYTRTVDIIRTIIGKFILTLDHQTEKYYSMQLEKGKIKEIPRVPLMRMKKLEQIHIKDTKIKDMVDFYVQLKAIYNADFKAKEEYRLLLIGHKNQPYLLSSYLLYGSALVFSYALKARVEFLLFFLFQVAYYNIFLFGDLV